MNHPKQIKDILYKLMQEPTLGNLRNYLKNNTGEHNSIDFKSEWINGGKLVKEMISIANYGGGVILFGVSEDENKRAICNGLPEIRDKAVIANDIKKYIPDSLKYEVYDFEYASSEYEQLQGKMFQLMIIEDTPENLPFLPKNDGDGIFKNRFYTRSGTSCVEANQTEINEILNRKMQYIYPETGKPLTLDEHFSQLDVLYKKISPTITKRVENDEPSFVDAMRSAFSAMVGTQNYFGHFETLKNPMYPDEGYEAFIARMIEAKKNKIERVLDLR